MEEDCPRSLEALVVKVIRGSFKSREVVEAEVPDELRPLEDFRVHLRNWSALVHRQGMTLAYLSVVPATRAELMSRMPALIESAPAWLDAEVRGEMPTLRTFAQGLAQTLQVQREQFERVVQEQVIDAGSIEAELAAAPVPGGHRDEPRSELIIGAGRATGAHTVALIEIAVDLETHADDVFGLGEE